MKVITVYVNNATVRHENATSWVFEADILIIYANDTRIAMFKNWNYVIETVEETK